MLTAIAAAAPADARITLVTADGTPSQLAEQLDHVQMPSPTGTITVYRQTCFDGQPRSCTSPQIPAVWIQYRADLLHELGHRFDYGMSEHARERFLTLIGQAGRPWRSPPNSPHEQFAEAWSFCAINPRRPQRDVVGYEYWPSRRVHRRVCRTIRREAERQGWRR
jgi:hypothetical protein